MPWHALALYSVESSPETEELERLRPTVQALAEAQERATSAEECHLK